MWRGMKFDSSTGVLGRSAACDISSSPTTNPLSLSVTYGKPIGNHGQKGGRLARHSRPDGAEDITDYGTAPWLRYRPPHRADQRRPAFRQLWDPLPSASQARAGRLHR